MKNFSCPDCHHPCPFAELTLQEAQGWQDLIKLVSFTPDQMLFEQGELLHGCYLLCQGWVLLRARTLSGRRLVVGLAGPGELVGMGSFLLQEYHELSAHALTEVRAQYLARAVCEQLIQEPSLLAGRLLAALASQIKWMRKQAQLFASGASVQERLAALILELGQRCGQRVESGAQRIELQLSCGLLGEMLDSHRVTVNDKLNELRRRGFIMREQGRIVILNEAGLRELAKGVF